MPENFTMDDILNANFGEGAGDIQVRYKKTINTRQYESEVVELETKLQVDKDLTGAERMVIGAVLAAQLEYTCYVNMFRKGQISQEDFLMRRTELQSVCNEISQKCQSLTGKALKDIKVSKEEAVGQMQVQ